MNAERTTKPISEALRELITARRLRLVDVWTGADISRSDLYRYLRGDRGRRMNSQALETVEKLARFFDLPPEYFMEYRQEKVKEMAAEAIREGILEPEDFRAYLEIQRELRKAEGQHGAAS